MRYSQVYIYLKSHNMCRTSAFVAQCVQEQCRQFDAHQESCVMRVGFLVLGGPPFCIRRVLTSDISPRAASHYHLMKHPCCALQRASAVTEPTSVPTATRLVPARRSRRPGLLVNVPTRARWRPRPRTRRWRSIADSGRRDTVGSGRPDRPIDAAESACAVRGLFRGGEVCGRAPVLC
jgi:hypothetical protein